MINGHPRGRSFCAALASAYAAGAREANCHVRELALADLNFDPDLHTVSPREQRLEPDLVSAFRELEWAQHIALVYPAWWGMCPARLKGFLDRILLPGCAFRELDNGRIEGLLGGRTAHLLTTLDMPPWVYRWIYRAGGHQALRRSTLGVCAIRCTRVMSFGPVNHSSSAQRSGWLVRAREFGLSIGASVLSPRQRLTDPLVHWLRALRLQFFPMSWLAYTLGALAASSLTAAPPWNRSAYWLGYGALFGVKVATVFNNERFDFESDRINRNAGPFNGGSRVLVDGSLDAGQLRTGMLAMLLAGAVCAIAAVGSAASATALVVILVAAPVAMGYTTPPLRLSWRGLGEVDVALTHSLAVILWGFALQGGDWSDPLPWALSLPLGLAILPAIILSSLPDRDADAQAGKRTLAVRFGASPARALAAASALVAVLATVVVDAAAAGAYAGLLPWIGAHALILCGLLYRRGTSDRGLQVAIVVALLFIMWFVLWPLWPLWRLTQA